MKKNCVLFMLFVFALSLNTFAQDKEKKADTTGYVFTTVKSIKVTPVKDQYRSGTCWSFSTIGFVEAELLRMGKGEYDLSDMFPVRKCYSEKAEKYVRMHGKINFAGGGAAHDVINVIRDYGIVPEQVYSGLNYGTEKHVHGEIDAVLKAYVDAVIKNKNKKITPVWHKGFDSVLDAYFGVVPETFTYKGKEYTPKSFAEELGFNPDDYVELTSYTHHPFYEKFILEVPDNWSWDSDYNVPMNELMEIIDNSINNGYTVAWGADVSEKGISFKNGVAVVPDADVKNMTDTERAKWEKLTKKEKDKQLYKFDKPGKEKEITQEMRQEGFDNWTTGDDHGMLITGIAKDQIGHKYYIIKNSWGPKVGDNDYNGYFYASENYVQYKTMDILVHKNAIPKKIKKKLHIK
ncbi:MAG: aminopeptidase [Bacteroidales bacterium]|nr:aminopeptidase [Bacteroidales bacterium]